MNRIGTLGSLALTLGSLGCGSCGSGGTAARPQQEETSEPTSPPQTPATSQTNGATVVLEDPAEGREVAIFAGGCFWCMEPPFEALDGVDVVLSGYTGGPERSPSYDQVASGQTGHAEAVAIVFSPSAVSYADLVEVFWRNVDPTAVDRQFVDTGTQYRTGIFVRSEDQRSVAGHSKQGLIDSGRFPDPIVTPIEDAGPFWVAEDYHQDFYRTHPAHYQRYRRGSGRDEFITRYWGSAPSH